MTVKAERQKFYDDLLQKILALSTVQEDIAEFRKDEEWNKEYGQGEFEFEEQALENFIVEGDEKDILAVPEIWNMVQEEIRSVARWVTYDAKTFMNERSSLDVEDILAKKLEEIHNELYHALKRKHGKEKQNQQTT